MININEVKKAIQLDKLGASARMIAEVTELSRATATRVKTLNKTIDNDDREALANYLAQHEYKNVLQIVAEIKGYKLPAPAKAEKETAPVEDDPIEPTKTVLEAVSGVADNTATAIVTIIKKLNVICLKLDYNSRLLVALTEEVKKVNEKADQT